MECNERREIWERPQLSRYHGPNGERERRKTSMRGETTRKKKGSGKTTVDPRSRFIEKCYPYKEQQKQEATQESEKKKYYIHPCVCVYVLTHNHSQGFTETIDPFTILPLFTSSHCLLID